MTGEADYRPDIDGLRAIAVSAVVLFHAGFSTFSGGYVGVDVFFVISGYLITGMIVGQINAGTFSFPAFYARRARRLLPALFATIAATFAYGAFVQGAEDFQNLSGSAAAAVASLSNVYFWSQSGYFDTVAITKPLLHTWSLGVEEQFYLFWPVFLFLALPRIGPSMAPILIGLVALVSFGACLSMMAIQPSAAFFWTPFRMFEFATGALIVFVPARKAAPGLAYIAGLGMVFWAILRFSETTPFPGWSVLLPTVGAAFMIYGGKSRLSALLCYPAAAWLGRITYSVYLVHWPLAVFTVYSTGRDLTITQGIVIVVSSVLVGALLHHIIEKPVRYNIRFKGRRLVAGLGMAATAVILPSAHSWATHGWIWRLPASIRSINNYDIEAMKTYVWANEIRLQRNTFKPGRRHIFIIGDSQSADLVNVLHEAGVEENVDLVTYSLGVQCNVPYVEDETYWLSENYLSKKDPSVIDRCKKSMETMLTSRSLREADAIIVAFEWLEPTAHRMGYAAKKLTEISGAPVYVVGRKDLKKGSIEIVNLHGRLNGLDQFAAKFKEPDTGAVNSILKGQFGNRYIDFFSLVCPNDDQCLVLDSNEKPLFYNASHLTREGARFFAKRLVPQTLDPANLVSTRRESAQATLR